MQGLYLPEAARASPSVRDSEAWLDRCTMVMTVAHPLLVVALKLTNPDPGARGHSRALQGAGDPERLARAGAWSTKLRLHLTSKQSKAKL